MSKMSTISEIMKITILLQFWKNYYWSQYPRQIECSGVSSKWLNTMLCPSSVVFFLCATALSLAVVSIFENLRGLTMPGSLNLLFRILSKDVELATCSAWNCRWWWTMWFISWQRWSKLFVHPGHFKHLTSGMCLFLQCEMYWGKFLKWGVVHSSTSQDIPPEGQTSLNSTVGSFAADSLTCRATDMSKLLQLVDAIFWKDRLNYIKLFFFLGEFYQDW